MKKMQSRFSILLTQDNVHVCVQSLCIRKDVGQGTEINLSNVFKTAGIP